MDPPKIVENIFFSVTCVSVFTCIIRSDYNFAMGLLCFYMIKNAGEKIGKIAGTLLLLNIMTIAMDVLWILVMRSVWDGKPSKNATSWKAFDNIRSLTILLSEALLSPLILRPQRRLGHQQIGTCPSLPQCESNMYVMLSPLPF